MRWLWLACALFFPFSASASWELSSEFRLHLHAKTFDSLVNDFWNRLQGRQSIPLDNIYLQNPVPISITGLRLDLNYDFNLPVRDPRERMWTLDSKSIDAKLYVNSVNASQIIEKEVGGIIVSIELKAECHNIVLALPKGQSAVHAVLRADLRNNQVQLSMPEFQAAWQHGAWQVENMECTGASGFDQIVKTEALKTFQTIDNFQDAIVSGITAQLKAWSKDASVLLLSSQELPSKREDLKIYFEPHEALDAENGGVYIQGKMRFFYPYVSQGNDIRHEFPLKTEEINARQSDKDSYLLMPLNTVRGLIMGEYLTGKLEYSMFSNELQPFQDLMQSRWKQFFVWPDLMNFSKHTIFAFQFLVFGAPSFENAHPGAKGEIAGDMVLPLRIRMYAPKKGAFVPYVEFVTNLQGASNLKLQGNGKVLLNVNTNQLKIDYYWSRSYVNTYGPYTRIGIETIAGALKSSLGKQGLELSIPQITIGKSVQLKPLEWNLENENVRVLFDASSAAKK